MKDEETKQREGQLSYWEVDEIPLPDNFDNDRRANSVVYYS